MRAETIVLRRRVARRTTALRASSTTTKLAAAAVTRPQSCKRNAVVSNTAWSTGSWTSATCRPTTAATANHRRPLR